MKPSHEWNEDDVIQLINQQVEENVELDYKAIASLQKNDGKKIEISKDVSALANSIGGTIVYGVAESKDGRHLPVPIDGGYDAAEISKEWLEQVINSRIHPRIESIRINSIQLNKTAPGKVIYVVSIPEGITAYQAADYRYYKRFNFESVPMEDYEIRLVMNRARYPLLVPTFKYQVMRRDEKIHIYRLCVDVRNNGMVRAIDIGFHLMWPLEVNVASHGSELREYREERINGRRCRHFVITLFGSRLVIFPTDVHSLIPPDAGPFHLEYTFDQATYDHSDLKLIWKVYAADAPPQQGEVPFNELNEF